MRYYNRQILPGVGLIGVEGGSVCPYEVGPAKGSIIESFGSGEEFEERLSRAYRHRVSLPESYMRRAHEAYERDKKPNEAIKQKLIQNFINRHPPQK